MNSSNWWANKLAQGTPTQAPMPQAPPPQATPPTTPQPAYLPPDLQERRLPESATSNSRCPGCGSGNYGSGIPNVRARCYDCGYPITQTGTGVSGVSTPSEGPVQAAKQVSTQNNFNPQTIIGKVG
jgi:hypothetical protein